MSTTFLLCCVIAALVLLCFHYGYKAAFYKDIADINSKAARNAQTLNKILQNELKKHTTK